jgi:hypothetical protein
METELACSLDKCAKIVYYMRRKYKKLVCAKMEQLLFFLINISYYYTTRLYLIIYEYFLCVSVINQTYCFHTSNSSLIYTDQQPEKLYYFCFR